jgi:hypothetical protein
LVGCSGGPAASNDTLADRRPAPSPRYDGRRDQAIVPAGENGRTFAIDIPVAAIVPILVSASGTTTERSGSCFGGSSNVHLDVRSSAVTLK